MLVWALLIRLSPWTRVFHGGNVYFIDTDDYYHLRRMMVAAANFPKLPSFDYYLGYPGGFHANWPPLYDLFGGLMILLVGAGHVGLKTAQVTAAFIPPLAGTATLWIFYNYSAGVLERRAARLSLLFASLMPMLVFYTALGRPDHHCFENFWLLLALLFWSRLGPAPSGKRAALVSSCVAVCLAIGTMFWIGLIVFTIMFFLHVASEMLIKRRQGIAIPGGHLWLHLIFLVQAPIFLALAFANHWYSSNAFLFDAPSPFQPLLAACLALWTLCVHRRCSRGLDRLTAVFFAAAAILSTFLLFKSMESLALFFSALPRIFESVTEIAPFFKPNGVWSLENVSSYFGALLWVIPPAAALFAWNDRDEKARLIALWLLITAVLALRQTRYAYHFSLPASLILGYGADWALTRWDERARKAKSAALQRACGRLLLAAVAVALAFPALKNVAALLFVKEGIVSDDDLIATCDWIREHTPATRSLWSDQGTPEYGVYALHDIGDEIAAIAQRPAVAGNMHVLRQSLLDSVSFFFIANPDRAARFLSARKFRYVLLQDYVGSGLLPEYARLFHMSDYEATFGADRARTLPAGYWNLVYMRLFFFDGSLRRYDRSVIAPVGRFRLIYESPRGKDKVFEVVPGARIAGSCRTGSVWEAEIPVDAGQGRRFTYRNAAECGRNGRYEITVPYPGDYTVGSGKLLARRHVAEAEIQGSGRVLE
ncbi:MAG: STT3 domain-containing protein [Elusimicrobiota bacterium]